MTTGHFQRADTGRILYLDIDGTVRHGFDELGRHVRGPADVVVFPEVPPLLRAYKLAGWGIVGVSNQGGIALGYVTVGECEAAMHATDLACGHLFDSIHFCWHHPSAQKPHAATCWCRKPSIGMLVEQAVRLQIETGLHYPPYLSLMVGDRPEDADCAAAARVPFMAAAAWRATSPEAVLAGTAHPRPASPPPPT